MDSTSINPSTLFVLKLEALIRLLPNPHRLYHDLAPHAPCLRQDQGMQHFGDPSYTQTTTIY